MARGTFIILEGGDGSGKTTHIERLKKEFPAFVYTQDPGGTPLGTRVRDLLLSDDSKHIDAKTELLLFLASRAELVAQIIRPALKAGKTVVCNRFSLSSIAYQVYGRRRPGLLGLYRDVSAHVLEDCEPDACLLLDVSPEIAAERIRKRADRATRFDREKLEFHRRVRKGYKKHVGEFCTPFVINTERPQEQVWKDVRDAVQSVL